MDNEHKYIMFPIALLKGMFTDKNNAINDILDIGIYWYSKRIKYNHSHSLSQLIYCYYRDKDSLSAVLTSYLDNLVNSEEWLLDEDYNGFSGIEFNPEYELETLEPIIKSDTLIQNEIKQWYSFRQALKELGIKGNAQEIVKSGKQLEKEIPNQPSTWVKVKTLFQLREAEQVNEIDTALFCAFLGIKSIGGKKPFFTTNKDHIVARMFGYKSYQQIEITHEEPLIEQLIIKYSKRYHQDRLKDLLEANGYIKNIIAFPRTRKMYVNMKLNEDEFIEAVSQSITKTEEKAKRERLKTKRNLLRDKINDNLKRQQQKNI
jgi:hypothetical protein